MWVEVNEFLISTDIPSNFVPTVAVSLSYSIAIARPICVRLGILAEFLNVKMKKERWRKRERKEENLT